MSSDTITWLLVPISLDLVLCHCTYKELDHFSKKYWFFWKKIDTFYIEAQIFFTIKLSLLSKLSIIKTLLVLKVFFLH